LSPSSTSTRSSAVAGQHDVVHRHPRRSRRRREAGIGREQHQAQIELTEIAEHDVVAVADLHRVVAVTGQHDVVTSNA
jgi:hypothetical protein